MSRFEFTPTPLKDCFVITPKPIKDERGYFERYFCANDFREIGFDKNILQINHSQTTQKGIIRGLHFQTPPFCEIKIVRCLKGAIYDVALDLRQNSPTFLQYFGVILSAENAKYLYIPDGFAHGFQAMSDDVEILYLCSEFFEKQADSVINPLDPKIAIDWKLPPQNLSQKDANAPFLGDDFMGLIV
ncbi:dTDP-4-dehydrorhamnose 3,5-epimerase [Helicobacter sp. 23-1045]